MNGKGLVRSPYTGKWPILNRLSLRWGGATAPPVKRVLSPSERHKRLYPPVRRREVTTSPGYKGPLEYLRRVPIQPFPGSALKRGAMGVRERLQRDRWKDHPKTLLNPGDSAMGYASRRRVTRGIPGAGFRGALRGVNLSPPEYGRWPQGVPPEAKISIVLARSQVRDVFGLPRGGPLPHVGESPLKVVEGGSPRPSPWVGLVTLGGVLGALWLMRARLR